jgi:hypothetical protein
MNILEQANNIVNNRSEEQDRTYGDFDLSMERMSAIATVICNKNITPEDCFKIMMALKLSREAHTHKVDNMLDLAAYAQGLVSYIKNNK